MEIIELSFDYYKSEDEQKKESPLFADVHFHDILKQCTIAVIRTNERVSRKTGQKIYDEQYYCRTHDAWICRCGWELGWHWGTSSRLMFFEARAYNKDRKIIKPQLPWNLEQMI